MPKKHGNQVCRLLHLQVDQWHTVVITQVVSLNNCDLFLFISVTRMKQLEYCKIVEENFNFVAQDILVRTRLKILMVFTEPWVKHSLGFSCFFSFLHQFIDSKKKTSWQLIQSANIKYKLCEGQNYLYDRYNLIRKQEHMQSEPKDPKYTLVS